MSAGTRYNEAVRSRFTKPVHAGELRGVYELELAADVSESEHGAQITLSAGIRDGAIAGMAYRVWGCPHLIAALEMACASLVEQPPSGLEKFDLRDITRELSVPPEKTGRILLVEDALASLGAQYAGVEN